MSEIVKVGKDKLASSLRDELSKRFGQSNHRTNAECLLLDISSSMLSGAGTGRSRIEELRDLVVKFPGVRKFVFPGGSLWRPVEELAGSFIPEPHGTTPMAEAFASLKQRGLRSAVVITDGRPDSEDEALAEAGGLKLDIIYVGPEPVPQFLIDLARQTGGDFMRGRFDCAPAIETKIKGLLGWSASQGADQAMSLVRLAAPYRAALELIANALQEATRDPQSSEAEFSLAFRTLNHAKLYLIETGEWQTD